MSKDLTTQNTAVSTAVADLGAWGAPAMDSRDIIIPKILCMQGLSELVTDDKAKMGDFVDSMTSTVIGNYEKKPITFIPFHLEKIWIISEKKQGEKDFSFKTIEKVTPANINKKYSEFENDVEIKNEYCMNFYVLRPDAMTLPSIISFKGMSSKEGKVLATKMYVANAAEGKIPPAFAMELSGKKDKNDKGTFITLKVSEKRESTADEIAAAFKWYKLIQSGQAKAHEEQGSTSSREENRF